MRAPAGAEVPPAGGREWSLRFSASGGRLSESAMAALAARIVRAFGQPITTSCRDPLSPAVTPPQRGDHPLKRGWIPKPDRFALQIR